MLKEPCRGGQHNPLLSKLQKYCEKLIPELEFLSANPPYQLSLKHDNYIGNAFSVLQKLSQSHQIIFKHRSGAEKQSYPETTQSRADVAEVCKEAIDIALEQYLIPPLKKVIAEYAAPTIVVWYDYDKFFDIQPAPNFAAASASSLYDYYTERGLTGSDDEYYDD